MFKSTGEPEKAILLVADSSTPPLELELVVAVAAAAGADVEVAEEEVVEVALALQRRHHRVQMRRFLSMQIVCRSRLNGGNTHGQPHNNLLPSDTLQGNTRIPHRTLHGSLLLI